MACLDTTFLIDLAGGGGKHRQARAETKLRELAVRQEPLWTTRFNVAELYVGVFRARDPQREERAIQTILSGVGIMEFGASEAEGFGRITAHLQQIGRPAGDMDVLIAATVLSMGEYLVTDNRDHFADIPGLRVESY